MCNAQKFDLLCFAFGVYNIVSFSVNENETLLSVVVVVSSHFQGMWCSGAFKYINCDTYIF
jgi:hypothetical protein